MATAFGLPFLSAAVRAQTPIAGREMLPIPQAKGKAPLALDARDAQATPIRPLRAPDGAPNIVIVLSVGKGGMGTLFVDGQQIGQGRVERTVPFLFSADDFTDIGKDYGAPVTEDYATPHGRFTGTINWVRIDIGKDAFDDPAGQERALRGRS